MTNWTENFFNKRDKLWYKVYRAVRRWEPIYWLRTHIWNRYHIVNVSGQGDYKWGYCDPCHKMYLACFAILCDFVENEYPTIGESSLSKYYTLSPNGKPMEFEVERDWWEGEKEGIEIQINTELEIYSIYKWWKFARKVEQENLNKMLDGVDLSLKFKPTEDSNFVELDSAGYRDDPRWEAWKKENERLEEKEEEMLTRLMKVRQSLWT